jgi:hypothetical protein
MPNSKSIYSSLNPSQPEPRSETIKNISARMIPPQYVGIIRYFQRLAAERFFGDLIIGFTKGEITLVRVEQTLKPFDLVGAESPAATLGTAGVAGGVE